MSHVYWVVKDTYDEQTMGLVVAPSRSDAQRIAEGQFKSVDTDDDPCPVYVVGPWEKLAQEPVATFKARWVTPDGTSYSFETDVDLYVAQGFDPCSEFRLDVPNDPNKMPEVLTVTDSANEPYLTSEVVTHLFDVYDLKARALRCKRLTSLTKDWAKWNKAYLEDECDA